MHTRVARSPALAHWQSISRTEIDHLVDAHHVVRAIGPAGAPAAEQIIHALVVQLAARFQRYCRDLHDVCWEALAAAVPPAYRPLLEAVLLRSRKLDRQNATTATLAHDFGLFGLRFWSTVEVGSPGTAAGRFVLDEVNAWRNAIAHQDLGRLLPDDARTQLDLLTVRRWRARLDELAVGIDQVVYGELRRITGSAPW